MEIESKDVLKAVKKELKERLFKYIYVEGIYAAIISILIYFLLLKENVLVSVLSFNFIIFVTIINYQNYINISRDSKMVYYNKLSKGIFKCLKYNLKYNFLALIIKCALVVLTLKYVEYFGYFFALYFVLDILFMLKAAIIYRKVNGEDVVNEFRIAEPLCSFLPRYNFDAENYTTVNTQTKKNEKNEYVINLFDANITEKKEDFREEENKITNYLDKLNELYDKHNVSMFK